MRAYLTMLSPGEIEKIHQTTLDVLEKVGVKVTSPWVAEALAKAGAKLEGELLRFPRAMVEDLLGLAVAEFTLAARNPAKSLALPAGEFPYSSTAGYGPFVLDRQTGEKRKSTSEDLREFCVIADYLDCVDLFWPTVMPTEEAPDLEEYLALDVAFRHVTKHIQTTSSTGKNAAWHVRLASLVAGGEDKLRARPLFSAVASPNTPLAIEKDVAEATYTLAKAGVPLAPMNVPMAGTTSPVTLAGTMVVCNAEELTSYIIAKVANQGATMLYSTDMGAADMRTGVFHYDSLDYPKFGPAAAQIAGRYRLPGLVAHGSCETMPYDLVSLERNVYRTLVSLASRTDASAWMGGFEACLGGTITGLLTDAEVLAHVKGFIRQHQVDEESLAYDVIAQVGPQGNFLTSEHTLRHLRQELWTLRPEDNLVLDHKLTEDFLENARQTAARILAEHQPTPLDEVMEKEMDKLRQEARRDILGE